MSLDIVGTLYVGKPMNIVFAEDQSYRVQLPDGNLTDFTFEERIMYLCKPWADIETYENEQGIHYMCHVYDGVYIDIWAPDIKSLLNRICSMLEPPEDIEDWLLDRVEKANKLREENKG